MAASSSDLLLKGARAWVGQIGSGGVSDAVVTTVPLASSTNLPTDTAVVATIDRVDANGTATASKEEVVIGVVSGSNLTSVTRGVEGTAQAHDAGAVVEILFTATNWSKLIDHLLVQHSQAGTHTNITACNITASGTQTLSHVTASDVTARVLLDVNANEMIKYNPVASAVNEVTVTNAATGNSPMRAATGEDTNIGLIDRVKGTGVIAQDGPINYAADAGSTDAYAITINGISTYFIGQVFHFKANTVNTGAATLNVNSLGAKTIKKNYDSDLADGDIKANQLVSVIYDGTNMQLLSPISNVATVGSPKRVRVEKTANQSINNTTSTTITFDSEVFDTDTMHDNATNNTRITINTAGVYLIKAQVAFASNSTGRREIRIAKNGDGLNVDTGAWYGRPNDGDRTTAQASAIVVAAESDYFEVQAWQNSGGALNIEGSTGVSYRSHFEAIRLGPSA